MTNLSTIIAENLHANLVKARQETDKNPTDGQKEAGNYKKGHVNIHGFNISIENPKGSYRRGKDKSGKEWKVLMHNDYGYFTRTLGKDGDAIDVFIGPNLESEKVFPVDQYVNGEFDETKVMLGFDSAEEAKAAYLSNYEKGWKGFKYITEVDMDTFKRWLYDGYRQRKPFAKYKSLDEGVEILNEKFSSGRLATLAKEHGGIAVSRNGGLRDFPKAWQYGRGVNVSELTDDMLVGEPFKYEWGNMTSKQRDNAVLFNDGYAVELRSDAEIGRNTSGERRLNRYGSGIGDTGDHDKSRGGFVGTGKDQLSSPYNGWHVSDRAGAARSMRQAIDNNKQDIDYIEKHKDKYRDWKERIAQGKNNISSIKGRMKELRESELNEIISKVIEEYLTK